MLATVVVISVIARGSSSVPASESADAALTKTEAGTDGTEDPGGACPDLTEAPAGQPAAEKDRRPVPILMYHEIAAPPASARYPELFVEPDDFASQIKWLDSEGFTAITLDELDAGWSADGPPLPARPIVISFDDGLRGQYTNAFPELSKAGWPGVLNLKVGSLEQGEITEAMVCEMLAAGWELSSHTIDHSDLTTLSGAALRREVQGSGKYLRRRFGVPVRHFAYPAGRLDEGAVAAVREAGYSGALGTGDGLATPETRFEQRRVRVNRSDGLAGLSAKLEGLGG